MASKVSKHQNFKAILVLLVVVGVQVWQKQVSLSGGIGDHQVP